MFLLFYFQASQPNNEFIITFKKGAKKTDSMRFSSDQRAAIITEAMRWVIIRKYLTYIYSFPDTDTSLEKGRLCPSSALWAPPPQRRLPRRAPPLRRPARTSCN